MRNIIKIFKICTPSSAILIWLFLYLCACKDENKNYKFKDIPDEIIKHQLISVAKSKDGIRAQGFAGSAPADTQIVLAAGLFNQLVKSKLDGSFDIILNTNKHNFDYADLSFETSDKKRDQKLYQVRDLSKALANIAKTALDINLDLQDINIIGSKLAILSPTANILGLYNLKSTWELGDQAGAQDGAPASAIMLNPKARADLWPRMIDGSGTHALVPLFGTGELALLNLNSLSIVESSRLKDPNTNQLYIFDNQPSLNVVNAISADGSSPASTKISKSYAHSAERVINLGDNIYLASFSNYYQFNDPSKSLKSVMGFGLIALLEISDTGIKTLNIIKLDFKNPQFFIRDGADILVSCSGAFKDIGTDKLASDDAGIVKLKLADNKKSITVSTQITLRNFVPAEPALIPAQPGLATPVYAAQLVIPEAWGRRIAIIDTSKIINNKYILDPAKTSDIYKINTAKYDREFSYTFAAYWHQDIVFLGEAQGVLVAYSLTHGFLPFPFIEPIVLDANISTNIKLNPTKIIFRHQAEKRGLDSSYTTGFSGLVLSSNLGKIIPIDFLEIFGP